MKARWCVGTWQRVIGVEKNDYGAFLFKTDNNPDHNVAWERKHKYYFPYLDLLDDELEQEIKLLEMM